MCDDLSSLESFMSLQRAGASRELSLIKHCYRMPEGTKVLRLRTVADYYMLVAFEWIPGEVSQFWTHVNYWSGAD